MIDSRNVQELLKLPDKELATFLKIKWGFGKDEELKVFGVLELIFKDDKQFYRIVDLRKHVDSPILRYPIVGI